MMTKPDVPTTTESRQTTLAQQLIGLSLRAGVGISAIIVIYGAVLYLMQFGMQPANLSKFTGQPESLTQIPTIFQQAIAGHSPAIIQSGLLILIFTPIFRVAVSVILFLIEKDWLYVGITLLVLALLMFGLFGEKL